MFYATERNDHGLPDDPFKAIVAPRPIGWITSRSANGEVNLAPYSFFNGYRADRRSCANLPRGVAAMTSMPLVPWIRDLIADGKWHRFEEIADAIVGPADDLHMILFRMRDLGEIDILKAGGWSLKIRLRDPSAKPIRGQPPTPPLPRPGRWPAQP